MFTRLSARSVLAPTGGLAGDLVVVAEPVT